MFLKTPREQTGLEIAIDQCLAAMKDIDPDTDDYAKIVKQVESLHKLKEAEIPERVNINTLLTVIANLAGVAMIIHYEQANVLASKALSLLKIR